jgi:hypothetical protein
MGRPSKAVQEFMAKHKVASDEIWEVHGSQWVVKHKALERIAAEQGIIIDLNLKVCDLDKSLVVVLATGKLGEATVSSFGESSPKNCKNAYPVAMAEKRAADRVILKLLTSHGALYSESEADDFAQPRQNPHVTRPEDVFDQVERDDNGQPIDNIPQTEAGKKLRVVDQRPIFERLQKQIHATGSPAELKALGESRAFTDDFACLKADWQEFLRGVYAEHQKELRKQATGDDMRLAG